MGPDGPAMVRSPIPLHKFLSFSAVSLFVGSQINPVRTNSSRSTIENQALRFSVKIFSQSALARRPEETFFTPVRTCCQGPCL